MRSSGSVLNMPDIVPEVNKICLYYLIYSFVHSTEMNCLANARLRWQVVSVTMVDCTRAGGTVISYVSICPILLPSLD